MPPSAASIALKSPAGDNETFSTPPSTPSAFAVGSSATSSETSASSRMSSVGPTNGANHTESVRPSTSRRPSSLLLPTEGSGWVENVELVHEGVVDHTTPRHTPNHRGVHSPLPDTSTLPKNIPAVLSPLTKFHASQGNTPKPPATGIVQALKSPCFVHSLLDKGASLSDWLRDAQGRPTHHMQPSPPSTNHSLSGSSSEPDYDEDDDEYSGSLTRQLAETAVGVREMSKQLGAFYP